MKKSIGLLLILILLFSVNFQVFANTTYNSKEYKVSQIDKYNYVKADIDGSVLNLEIQNVSNKNDCFVKINGVKLKGELKDNNCFYISFNLKDFEDGSYNVYIYLGNIGDEMYWTFLRRDIIIVNNNGDWSFKKEEFYDNNKVISDMKNSSLYQILPVTDFVKEYSNNIVGNSKTDEEKIAKIYKWIVENIAYDYDSYWKDIDSYDFPDFILQEKKAVCYGISLTFQALCSAQNIPSIVYRGYSYDEENDIWGSHAWNEVYINSEWFVFDCTEDLYYGFQNGEIKELNHNKGIYYHSFMDMNSASINLKYEKEDWVQKEIKEYYGNFSNSKWATDDILNSIYLDLYNGEQEGDFTRPITRAEFCELLYYYICVQFYDDNTFNYTQDDLNNLLWDGGKKYYYPFKDNPGKYKPYIYCCYKTGIVNGKSEEYFGPDDFITREEAATILVRTIDFFEKQNGNFKRSYNTNIKFSDDIYISDWAKNSISIISDMGIMNGIGNNCFDPKRTYTVEQTIVTLYRLFKYNYSR